MRRTDVSVDHIISGKELIHESGFIVCGFAQDNNLTPIDAFFVKYSATGGNIWSRILKDPSERDRCLEVIESTDGTGYFFIGET